MSLSPEPNGDALRPSHDSQNGLLRSVPRPLEPHVSTSAAPEPYAARLEFERPPEEAPPPPRHPSRQQMMRWGPPPSEYGWDDRDDRRPYYSRMSYDYPQQERGVPVPNEYYEEPYYKRRYRPQGSMREPRRPSTAGPPRPSRRPRQQAKWEEASDDESDVSVTPRKKRRGDRDGTPPPEEILRLPFTMWMNSSLKNRKLAKSFQQRLSLTESCRLCSYYRGVCWHNHVFILRLRRDTGRKLWSAGQYNHD